MKIYTKTGDDGTTGLFNGERVSKSSLRVETYGTVDELNSIIGLAYSSNSPEPVKTHLHQISNLLFNLGSDLATPKNPPPSFEITRLEAKSILFLESLIDLYDDNLPELKRFILPGGSMSASFLHQARTVCRRAERLAVRLTEIDDIGEIPVKFLNRLSDYLFTASRFANKLSDIEDVEWTKEIL